MADQEGSHQGMVARGFAVVDHPSIAVRRWSIQPHLARNDGAGEIPLADEIRNDIDRLAVDGAKDLGKGRLLFPKTHGDLLENSGVPDVAGVLVGRSA